MSGNVSRFGLVMAAMAGSSPADLVGAPPARQAPKRRRPQNKRSYADSDNGAKAVAKRLARLSK